jgi:hypothetical protein
LGAAGWLCGAASACQRGAALRRTAARATRRGLDPSGQGVRLAEGRGGSSHVACSFFLPDNANMDCRDFHAHLCDRMTMRGVLCRQGSRRERGAPPRRSERARCLEGQARVLMAIQIACREPRARRPTPESGSNSPEPIWLKAGTSWEVTPEIERRWARVKTQCRRICRGPCEAAAEWR